VWKTYQGTKWEDAKAVAEYVIANRARLEGGTRKFAEAFFSSTLPSYVLDAVSSQMSILRTSTVTRLPDGRCTDGGLPRRGRLLRWDLHARVGLCADDRASLPKLERGMREIDFAYEPAGGWAHAIPHAPAAGTMADHGFHAAADGQMGNVLRTYREWQICGDDAWLAKVWPSGEESLEYAWSIGMRTRMGCSTASITIRWTSSTTGRSRCARACTWRPCGPVRKWRGR